MSIKGDVLAQYQGRGDPALAHYYTGLLHSCLSCQSIIRYARGFGSKSRRNLL